MRCFVACFVDEDAAGLVCRCPRVNGVRWLPPENLHATLRFLGEIDELQVARVIRLITALKGTPVTTRVSCLDGFPQRRRARAVVARLAATPELETWAQKLSQTLGEPDKPFVPHVTVGRSRGRASIPEAPSLVGFPIILSAPALYVSLRGSSGASYRRISDMETHHSARLS